MLHHQCPQRQTIFHILPAHQRCQCCRYRIPFTNILLGLELCQSRRAKKPEVRAAIIDLYPADGGGKRPAIGTKAEPGQLYGVAEHAWDALAVVLAVLRQQREGR